MGGRCKEGEQLDLLTKSCVPCRMLCQQSPAVSRCAAYCNAAMCEAKPGHYYDRLVRRCMKCAEICGKHPAECSPHCPTPLPPAMTKRLLSEVSRRAMNTKLPLVPVDSTVQLYSLLAVCTVLLLFSFSLALIVFLKRPKAKDSNTRPTTTKDQKQTGKKSDFPLTQTGRSPKDFAPTSTYPAYSEPSEDCYPTETCMCVHCFPDLRGFSQDSSRPQRQPYSNYQQGILHRAHIPHGGSVWTGGNLRTSSPGVQQDAAVG